MGESMADEICPDGLFVVRSGDVDAYRAALAEIEDNRDIVRTKSEHMRALARRFDSKTTYGAAIDHIVATPPRRPGDYARWDGSVLDYAAEQNRTAHAQLISERIGDWLAS